ncbi:MAG: twin-arginine translocase subunit TatC [Candidatus Eremiobacteraeota bacterium]|nr:twin-arginine translocase subunit TatC [Candidatus Eremiobacteraeota bacterium]
MIAERPPLDEETRAREVEWDQKEMPFTEHLRELRNRLFVCVVTVLGLAVLLLWPAQLAIPRLTQLYFGKVQLHAFGPADAVWAIFKCAIYGAIVLGLPVILYELWMFVVPAVHPRTRKAVYSYVAPSFFLALLGIAFAHFLVLPRVVGALETITSSIAVPTYGIESTLNLILLLFLAFAIVFQTPVVMLLLARIGLVNSTLLRKYRKYIGFAMLVAGAVLAPDGSPVTMTLIAAPMYVLFEISSWLIVFMEKRWKREDATEPA